MTARPTVVVAVHDGFYGCGTGAGHANHGFLHTLLALLPKGIHLAILPVRMAPDSPEYHPDWHRRVRAMLRDRDVSIHPIDNGTGGQDRWGALDNFRRCSAEAADRIRRDILPRAGRVLIVAFDVPFFGLAALLPPAVRRHLIIVPRSSGLLHAPHDTERIAWERDSLHAGLSAGTRIGTISPYMHRHLREDYGIPHRALREFADGLCAVDWRRLTGPATDIGIELPGEFVFTMGRAEPYKGFEDLLEAVAILRGRRKHVPHLVFAATTETSRPTDYQQYLAARIAELGIDATIVHRFTPAVPRILTHPGIRAVVVPSRAEPFGRIPMEAFAASAGPVVTTTAHGLSGQITDGVTGFTCPPGAPDALAAALSRALALDSRRRRTMLRRARAHALHNYDHEAMVRGVLAESAPWLMRAERENDRLRLPSCTRSIVTAGGSVQARPSVKVPIGLQARHWNTIRPERRVLVVAHHVTSLLRLVDMLTVFDSDPRVQLVFSWNGSDPFVDGIDECLGRLGAMVIPWHQAINTEFDLAIAANHGGLTEISADLIILPHGAGYTKNSPGEPGSRGAGEPGSRGAGEPGSRGAGPCSGCRRSGCCTTAVRSRRRWCSGTNRNWRGCGHSPRRRPESAS
ncbi:glycosyltransferase family 4 protein [Nocardia terpenica]|uniref:Glycosyl transferase family 1 domain-containing protein n=1 Tax=Nocardia terpenica TaxID=455432 RepID=A0A291RP76_9NOCA|nr:glycosyltransferase family 4 protein [Nocardia terpenica]ATL69421.1 hypothetical protein CRH09_27795 [Nocardia terpenica]